MSGSHRRETQHRRYHVLTESGKKRMSEKLRHCRFKLFIEQFARLRIYGSVQLILLVVESNHRLINRNVIRRLAEFWL